MLSRSCWRVARRAKRLFSTAIPFADAGRAIEEIAGLNPERAGHLGDAAAADAVLPVLVSLDLLKRDADGFAELLLAHFLVKRRPRRRRRTCRSMGSTMAASPPYRNRKLPRKRALQWNGRGLICCLTWDLVGFDRSAA